MPARPAADGARPVRTRLLAAVARAYLGKPDLAEFLALRFPDARSVLAGLRNELAFRLGWSRLAMLTTLNVELTSRCNVACSYCDVNRALGRPNQDLSLTTLARLVERTPGLQTLLPFQWGEPLLYGPLDEAIALASARGVRTYLTTNGTLLDGDRFARLARAGLTRLTISLDGDAGTHAQRRGYARAAILARLDEARARQRRDRLMTGLDVSMVVDASVAHRLDAFRRELSGRCDRVQFVPRMIRAPRRRPCREPTRGLMVVLSDGTVTTCCADVRGTLRLGHCDDAPPPELYRGASWNALRARHQRGDLPEPCASCGECEVPGVSPRFS